MDKLVPWERLERRIEPFYAKAGRGRRPYPLSVMLVHCVQLFYNLSDPGILLYEVESPWGCGDGGAARRASCFRHRGLGEGRSIRIFDAPSSKAEMHGPVVFRDRTGVDAAAQPCRTLVLGRAATSETFRGR